MRLHALVLALLASTQALAAPVSIDVSARIISNFKIGSSETHFGALEFNGGLELASYNRDFGSISAMRFLEPGSKMISVSDNGFWVAGTIDHDAAQHPSGMSAVRISEMTDQTGADITEKWLADAEGLLADGVKITDRKSVV